jgi:hypothetical protein
VCRVCEVSQSQVKASTKDAQVLADPFDGCVPKLCQPANGTSTCSSTMSEPRSELAFLESLSSTGTETVAAEPTAAKPTSTPAAAPVPSGSKVVRKTSFARRKCSERPNTSADESRRDATPATDVMRPPRQRRVLGEHLRTNVPVPNGKVTANLRLRPGARAELPDGMPPAELDPTLYDRAFQEALYHQAVRCCTTQSQQARPCPCQARWWIRSPPRVQPR